MKIYKNGFITYKLIDKKLVEYITYEEGYKLRDEYPHLCFGTVFDYSWIENRDIIYLYSHNFECYYFFCRNNDDLDYINVLLSLS